MGQTNTTNMMKRTMIARTAALLLLAMAALPAAGQTTTLSARSGSKMRIEGTSNIHDWQVESPFIGGMLEVGANFPLEPGQAATPGKVEVKGEVFIQVRSLKSVEKDGKPYSDKMDEVMWESLRSKQYPRIGYRSTELILKGATNVNEVLQYEFDSRGELVVGGVTNEITMPVFVLPLGDGKLRASGAISI